MKSLGLTLKEFGKQRGFSLNQLGINTRRSASYLSIMENERVDPCVYRLKAIAEALGVTIIDLFPNETQNRVVLRKSQRRHIEFPNSKTAVEPLIARGDERELDARLAIIHPGGSSEGFYRHAGGGCTWRVEQSKIDPSGSPVIDITLYPKRRHHIDSDPYRSSPSFIT